MLNLIEFFVFKVRFTSPFLFSVGTALGIGSFFTDSFAASLGSGICFGLIFLNILEENQLNKK